MQYHPDRNAGDAAAVEKFKEASEAYEVLSDLDQRARYDRYGHEGVRGAFSGGGFDWQDFHHFDDFGDIFGSLFDSLFGGGRGGRRSGRGGDILHRLSITLEEAAQGHEAELSVSRKDSCDSCHGTGAEGGAPRKRCPSCSGTGRVAVRHGIMLFQTSCEVCRGQGHLIDKPCKTCAGQGLTSKRVKASVKIPAGIHSGQRIQMRGEGHASTVNGSRGDLYVEVEVNRHRVFAREDDHIVIDLPITISQAALGDKVTIPTLWGETSLTIPAGTESHEAFRLKGMGMPVLNRHAKGDMFVRVRVHTPKKLSERQRELLQELAELDGDKLEPTSESLFERGKELFGKIFGA
jgi:molecular chaperone DnaJ